MFGHLGILAKLPKAIKEFHASMTKEEFKDFLIEAIEDKSLGLWDEDDFKIDFPQFSIPEMIILLKEVVKEGKVKTNNIPEGCTIDYWLNS